MRSNRNKVFVLLNFFLLWGFLNFEYLAGIINIFCIESFKEEILKANIKYNEEIANDTCNCYLEEFSSTKSHQKAISNCKLKTKKKFNL